MCALQMDMDMNVDTDMDADTEAWSLCFSISNNQFLYLNIACKHHTIEKRGWEGYFAKLSWSFYVLFH